MKLSTKSRYGVRLLLDMAINTDPAHINVAEIANRQDISPRYLEQIIGELKKSGIVRSVRGAYGGYKLNLPPSQITLRDILNIFEGDLLLVDEEPAPATQLEQCIQEQVYDALSERINTYLSSITLEQLTDKYRQQIETKMYYL